MNIRDKFNNTTNITTVIANHLIRKAEIDIELKTAIENKDDRTLDGCYDYIVNKANEILQGKNGMLADSVVFGFAEEYFLKDKIEEKEVKKIKANVKTSENNEKNTEKNKKISEENKIKKDKNEVKKTESNKNNDEPQQLSIFDF